MRVSWILCGALLVVAFAGVLAGPVEGSTEQEEQPSSGWKTFHAIKNFFTPVTNYFKGLPQKTPYDIVGDAKEKVTDVKEWAKENEAIQTLVSALGPVKNWIQDKAGVLKDKTFREMYDDVKTRVTALDDHIGSWIAEKNAQQKSK